MEGVRRPKKILEEGNADGQGVAAKMKQKAAKQRGNEEHCFDRVDKYWQIFRKFHKQFVFYNVCD